MQRARGPLGFVEIGEDAPALFVEGAAGGSDADAPRGAVKQARAETLLELEHVFAGGGARQTKLVRGAREAAGINDGGKNSCVFKAIHLRDLDCQLLFDNLFR